MTRVTLTSVLHGTGWLAFGLPFAVYLGLVWRSAVDVPFADDFDVFVKFLVLYQDLDSPLDRVELVFSLHNEHRLVLSRLAALVQYQLHGVLDFRELILFGALGWCG